MLQGWNVGKADGILVVGSSLLSEVEISFRMGYTRD